MSAQMGGLQITDAKWIGQHSLQISFASNLVNRYFQLYAGRRLVGVTETTRARRIIGQVMPTLIPAPMTVLAVTPDDRLTDYGPQLPPRPWNRYRLDWSTSAYPSDAKFFDLAASTVAGGAVDSANLIARIEYVGDIAYSFDLPELTSGGLWTYRLTPRDDALPLGNPGTPEEVEIAALVYPKDLALRSDGNRFTAAVEAGVLTCEFSY